MFISVLDLFKIGIGPSSSHTLGPMVAAYNFINDIQDQKLSESSLNDAFIRCTLKGSLAFTGKGHSTDRAVVLGLHGYQPALLAKKDVTGLIEQLWKSDHIRMDKSRRILFKPDEHIIFDKGETLAEHPNGMVFDLIDRNNKILTTETYFSIGGGFISALAEINQLKPRLKWNPLLCANIRLIRQTLCY